MNFNITQRFSELNAEQSAAIQTMAQIMATENEQSQGQGQPVNVDTSLMYGARKGNEGDA